LALKPITNHGKKADKMAKLLEHFEFMTGEPADMALVGFKRHVPSLVVWLQSRVEAEGRRARDLRVGAPWSATGSGVYKLEDINDELWVVDKASLVSHQIIAEERLCYKDGSLIPKEELNIASNFSAHKARVVSNHTPNHVLVIGLGHFGRKGANLATMQLLASGFAEESPAKKPRSGDTVHELQCKTEVKDNAWGSTSSSMASSRCAGVDPRGVEGAWQPPPPPGVVQPASPAEVKDMPADPDQDVAPLSGSQQSEEVDFDDSEMQLALQTMLVKKEETHDELHEQQVEMAEAV
jgi:hypothetical protein